jgi:imidazolonepropionase
MEELGIIEDAALAVRADQIAAIGKNVDILDQYSSANEIDATGKVVTPGFVDPHTHLVFAGSRESELELKIKGASYLEILQKGEGILKTVRDTRAATKEELLRLIRERSRRLLTHGTTTVEAKSGYGLTLRDEIKSLEVIREIGAEGPLTFVPTFLGAHAIPPEFQGRTHDYATTISEEWIPTIAKLKLAEYCDVFCEKGVFEIEDSRKILEAGKRVGLRPRIHADELYPLGGAELSAEVGAVSADHLLYASAAGIEQMKRAGVIAILLPAAPLTLMMDKYADARTMITERLPIALGSDLSPSCLLENQQLVISLACYKLKMTPAEAIVASTINAAHSLLRASEIGSIEVGKKADIVIFNAPDYKFLGYQLGSNLVHSVLKNGRQVVSDTRLID